MALRWSIPVSLLFLAACAGKGAVRLDGQFSNEVPPPTDVRIMLDPLYARDERAKKDAFELKGVREGAGFLNVQPTEEGAFTTEPIPVTYGRMDLGDPPPPTFFLSFINEQDTIYAVGRRHAVFQYRTYDAVTKAEMNRADACWKIIRGEFMGGPGRQVILSIFVAPNFDSPKRCLPEGTFTPGQLEMSTDVGE